MNSTKQYKVVMLPIKNHDGYQHKGEIYKFADKLHQCEHNSHLGQAHPMKVAAAIPQHVYIVSDDEVKEGDFILPTNTENDKVTGYNSPVKAKYNYAASIHNPKIVASTDSSLGLPSIPQKWIKNKYIASNGGITDVVIELFNLTNNSGDNYVLKLTDNNEIVIL